MRAVPDARVAVRDLNVQAGADLRAKAAAVADTRIRLLAEGPRDERAGEAAVGAELADDFLGNAYALFPAS